MSNPSFTTEAIWGAFQSAAKMRRKGLPDDKIIRRFEEVGLPPETAAALVQKELPQFISKTQGQGRMPGPPKVFISHSHHDRETASYLQKVLERNEVRTFFDQHQIVAGEVLEDRLALGLMWCEKLLLLWSQHSEQSEFVQWEWQRARFLMKQLIPYVLDGTQLPSKLRGFVHVDQSDQDHGHAQLLWAILGKGEGNGKGKRKRKRDSTTPFPGLWRAELSLAGLGEAEYSLELRANGQILGTGRIKESGLMGGLAQSLGVSHILSMKIPLAGTWSYKDREHILELDITATLMGQVNRDIVTIHTTGREQGWLHGQTPGGLPWRLRRVD